MAYSLPEFGHDDWQVWALTCQIFGCRAMSLNKPIAAGLEDSLIVANRPTAAIPFLR
jgi:hypothetical protein